MLEQINFLLFFQSPVKKNPSSAPAENGQDNDESSSKTKTEKPKKPRAKKEPDTTPKKETVKKEPKKAAKRPKPDVNINKTIEK